MESTIRSGRTSVSEAGRRYGVFLVLTMILGVRYAFCFITDEYGIPKEWKEQSGRIVTVEGYVTGKEDKEKVRVFYLSDHLIVYDGDFTEIPIGSRVRVSGEVQNFQEQRNPGGFDEEQYYTRRKYWAKLFSDRVIRMDDKQNTVKEGLYQLRRFWTEQMKEKLGDESGGILAAMVLGNKGSADADEKERYQKAGLGHLMAVSGCHVSLVAAAVYTALRKLRMRNGAASILTGSILYFYVLLCQSPVSAVRAYLMYMVLMGAKICGRVYQGKRTLFLTAFTVLMWRPMDIADAGFLLSFGAMAGIGVIYPILTGVSGRERSSGILVSLSVQLVLLPILLYFYYEIPVYSLLFGILAVGLFSILMICGCAGCIGCSLGLLLPACMNRISERIINAVWFPAGWILNVYHEICRLELKLPFTRWIAGRPGLGKILLYYILLTALLLLLKNKKKKALIPAVAGLVLLFIPLPNKGVLTFTMLDVGQGDGFVMEGPDGLTYLFDGGSSDQSQPGKYIIEPYLKYKGIGEIDYAFLSHGDQDHVNGVTEMLERQETGIKIRNIVLPEKEVWDDALRSIAALADEKSVPVLIMDADSSLTEGELEIQALYPESGCEVETGNEASLVLDIRYRDFSVLMTGDLGQEGEKILLDQNKLKRHTILKLGHHGSKNSSSREFLQKTDPKYAFISAGIDNIYGHPHKEVLDLLEATGINVYRTDRMGAVEAETDGETLRIVNTVGAAK